MWLRGILAQLLVQWTRPTRKFIRIQPLYKEGQSRPSVGETIAAKRSTTINRQCWISYIVSKSFDTYNIIERVLRFALQSLGTPRFFLFMIYYTERKLRSLTYQVSKSCRSFMFSFIGYRIQHDSDSDIDNPTLSTTALQRSPCHTPNQLE